MRGTTRKQDDARPCQAGRRLEWTRGESNPRPETARVMASTCLSDVFSDGLSSVRSRLAHRTPAPFERVQTSVSHLSNNVRFVRPACDFRLTTRRLGRHAEAVCIRQPCGPEHRSRCDRRLQRHRWQFLFCSRLIRVGLASFAPSQASIWGMPPPLMPSGRNRSRPWSRSVKEPHHYSTRGPLRPPRVALTVPGRNRSPCRRRR